ncbi:OmpH family outer membrane protein [Taibaiella soli]|uniref:OmpH family outer membrane protein n=1 Tax=Taibaiella soli TaxID=1649169 RepID=A0A2W2BFW5_9BACT|nr:OmpH family outer membrane protein [Taibaiella soli]PZF74797.1 hypothetical protein DN068_00955 [Taibaiella soli]
MSKKLSVDRILLSVTLCVTLVLLGNLCYEHFNKKGVVFVDINKLVEQYKFKKDMEATAAHNLYTIKNGTDSLKMLRRTSSGVAASHLDTVITKREFALEKFYEQSNQEISRKVWERLNPALERFGKDKGYEIVVGANGQGTVLYGSKQSDVTDEAIKYININYEKGS